MSFWTKVIRPFAQTAAAAAAAAYGVPPTVIGMFTGAASPGSTQDLLPPPQTFPQRPYAGPGIGDAPVFEQYGEEDLADVDNPAVSYTHLTLPTIYSV